jgi:hypothetical protein
MRTRVLLPLCLLAPATALAHAGGLEAAPIVGLLAGCVAGVLFVFVPGAWRRWFLVAFLLLLLAPVFVQVASEPEFPRNPMVALWWLSLAFPFLLLPAGLAFMASHFGLAAIAARVRAWRSMRARQAQQ